MVVATGLRGEAAGGPALGAAAEPGEADTHRERKKRATRHAIHLAALELAEQAGLAKVTTEAISERAGVAPRTFWSYFSSKEDAVLDSDPGRPEKLRRALLARPAGEDVVSSLRQVIEADVLARITDTDLSLRRGRLIRENPQLLTAVAANFGEIERALVSAVADRLGVSAETDMSPGVLVAATTGAFRVAQLRWADGGGRTPLQELIEEAFVKLGDGLAPLARRARPGDAHRSDDKENRS